MTIHESSEVTNDLKNNAHFVSNGKQFLRQTGQVNGSTVQNVIRFADLNVGYGMKKDSKSKNKPWTIPYTVTITGITQMKK